VLGWTHLRPFERALRLETHRRNQHQQLKRGATHPVLEYAPCDGQVQTCEYWELRELGPKRNGSVTIDLMGCGVGRPELATRQTSKPTLGWSAIPGWKLRPCIWPYMCVWDRRVERVSIPDYFTSSCRSKEEMRSFLADIGARLELYTESLRKGSPGAHPFIHPPYSRSRPHFFDDDDLKGRCCFSTHYYDGLTLMNGTGTGSTPTRLACKSEVCDPASL